MHNMEPNFHPSDIEIAFHQAQLLARAASALDCFELVRTHIYFHLYDFPLHEIYRSIFRNPPSWVRMGCALKAGGIFRQAMIHMIGQHPHWPWTTNNNLPDCLRSLIRRKADEISTFKSTIDGLLFASTLTVNGQAISILTCDETTINAWLVVSAWRNWFCHSLAQVGAAARNRNELDLSMYWLMAQGGEAYLPLASVLGNLRAVKGVELAPEDTADITNYLREMKEYAAEQVKPLCVHSMLDVNEHRISYFTGINIANSELPWASGDGMDEHID